MKRLMGLIGIALVLGFGCATVSSNWGKAIDAAHNRRFIPVELWAGVSWDGNRDIRLPEVNRQFGSDQPTRVFGPNPWVHPKTGKKYLVMERLMKRESGIKKQLYTINADGTGLGRVYDSRPEKGDRTFEGEVIFPLGTWSQGETRPFQYVEYTKAGPARRTATITIKRIDFRYRRIDHSLEYEWVMRDALGNALYHENYVYSPGRHLVGFKDLLSSSSARR